MSKQVANIETKTINDVRIIKIKEKTEVLVPKESESTIQTKEIQFNLEEKRREEKRREEKRREEKRREEKRRYVYYPGKAPRNNGFYKNGFFEE